MFLASGNPTAKDTCVKVIITFGFVDNTIKCAGVVRITDDKKLTAAGPQIVDGCCCTNFENVIGSVEIGRMEPTDTGPSMGRLLRRRALARVVAVPGEVIPLRDGASIHRERRLVPDEPERKSRNRGRRKGRSRLEERPCLAEHYSSSEI